MRYKIYSHISYKPIVSIPWAWLASCLVYIISKQYSEGKVVDSDSGKDVMTWGCAVKNDGNSDKELQRFKMTIKGTNEKNKKFTAQTTRLLSLGHIGTGVIQASMYLYKQAIEQAATVYWLNVGRQDTKPLAWLYGLSERHGRQCNVYCNLAGENPVNVISVTPAEIFAKKAICFHEIGYDNNENTWLQFKNVVCQILSAAKQHTNSAGVFVTIAISGGLSRFHGCEEFYRLLDSCDDLGITLHIINDNYVSGSDSEEFQIEAMKRGAVFDFADYRFSTTGQNNEGIASLTLASNRIERVCVKIDYEDLPVPREISPINFIK